MKDLPLHNRGFTLVELLVVVGILLLIALGAALLLKDTFSYNREISDRLTYVGAARRAMKQMTTELRGAAPSNLGAYPIATAGTSTIIFYTNIDEDTYRERVRYFLASSTLKRGVVEPSGSPLNYNGTESVTDLIGGVTNTSTQPIFTYYDDFYAGTSSPMLQPVSINLIRLLDIRVHISTDTNTTTTEHIQETQVTFRNLKDNL